MSASEISFFNGPMKGKRHAVLNDWDDTPPQEVRIPGRNAGGISTEYVYHRTTMVGTDSRHGYSYVNEVVVES